MARFTSSIDADAHTAAALGLPQAGLPRAGLPQTGLPPSRTRASRALTAALLSSSLLASGLLASATLSGCKKEAEPEKVSLPDPGGASVDLVSTEIGNGLGLPNGMAPTSMKFDSVHVLNKDSAVLTGKNATLAIALRTRDRGRSWEALRGDAQGWRSWGVGADGSAVLATGERQKAKPRKGQKAPIVKSQLWFGPAEKTLAAPIDFFPDEDKLKEATIASGVAVPALLEPTLASTIVDVKRSAWISWGRPAGQPRPEPLEVKGMKLVTTPYGRPAQLLEVKGRAVLVRPWPKPGEALQQPSPIPGLIADRNALAELSNGPGCEYGAFSYQRLGPKTAPYLLGVSPTRSFAFKLPVGAEKVFGCGPDAVVVEVFDAKKKEPQLIRCTLAGSCAKPASHPFEIWPSEHKRSIAMTATKTGVVALLTMKAGARWGVYLATSSDKGKTFELPRVVGQGQSDRGFFEVGALIGFEKRIVLLLTANVTGSSRRKWYVLASDDGGSSWGPP